MYSSWYLALDRFEAEFDPSLSLSLLAQDVVFEIQGSFAKANNTAEECLSSMRTVRSFANEEAEFQTFKKKLRHTLKIFTRKAIYYGAWMLSNNVSVHDVAIYLISRACVVMVIATYTSVKHFWASQFCQEI